MEVTQEHCERVTAVITNKLDKLDETIRGNGKPGMLVRMDRIERAIGLLMRVGWMLCVLILTQAMPGIWKAIQFIFGQ